MSSDSTQEDLLRLQHIIGKEVFMVHIFEKEILRVKVLAELHGVNIVFEGVEI